MNAAPGDKKVWYPVIATAWSSDGFNHVELSASVMPEQAFSDQPKSSAKSYRDRIVVLTWYPSREQAQEAAEHVSEIQYHAN